MSLKEVKKLTKMQNTGMHLAILKSILLLRLSTSQTQQLRQYVLVIGILIVIMNLMRMKSRMSSNWVRNLVEIPRLPLLMNFNTLLI